MAGCGEASQIGPKPQFLHLVRPKQIPAVGVVAFNISAVQIADHLVVLVDDDGAGWRRKGLGA
jgi:hypothetical protein